MWSVFLENCKNCHFLLQLACGNGNILVILFKKIGYFFSKIRKKWKKSKKNILKIINITHSVSRPKRDSIYSFMRHSGPLGCITTEIFSENHCCLKRRFSENLDSTVSTGQLEQKMTLFAIFP